MMIRGLLKFITASALAGISTLAMADQEAGHGSITIGMSTPLSGPNGAYGREMREAIQNYIDFINAQGGVHNRTIKLVSLDDAYDADKAVANTRRLIEEEKVFALVGYYGSSSTAAAMKVFSAAKVPLVGAVSGAESLRSPVNRYMFNVRASYRDETAAIVNHLHSLGLKEIGVFYQNDDFGKSGLAGVTEALQARHLAPVVAVPVERNSVDVSAAVKKMAEVHPQAVIMATLYKPTAAFVRQMKQAGLRPTYAALSPVSADLLAADLGDDSRGIGVSQAFPYPWNDVTPVNKEYKQITKSLNKPDFTSYYTLGGFINAKVLVEGIRRAGKQLTTEKLVASLEEMRRLDLGGYQVNYTPSDHSGGHFVDITAIGPKGRILQ